MIARYFLQIAPKLIGLLPLLIEVLLRFWNSKLKKKPEKKENENG